MEKKTLMIVILVLLIGITAGCASLPDYRPDLPEDIGSKGLVVGQVVGIGRLSQWSIYKDVLINKRKRSKVVNGFIAIPLSPGEYTFDGLYSQTYGGSSSYGGTTVTTTYTTTLPIKQKFTVRPKEVTNLGLLVLYPDPRDKKQKKFLRLFVDNTADMKHFLKTSYPMLASKLRTDAVTLAPSKVMSAKLLKALRKDVATKAAIGSGGYANYVAGHIGTLAAVQKDRKGKVRGVKMIAVPTVSNLQSRTPNYVKDRFAFLTTNNRLFVVRKGKATEKKPPAGLRAGMVYALGKKDLVIVDDKFEIYTSYDNGKQWHSYLGYVTENKTNVKVAPSAGGYYAYIVKPPRLLFGAYGRIDFRPIELPPDMKELGLLREKPAGLFAEQEISFWKETKPRPFFFRPASKAAWEARFMPAPNCKQIKFLDKAGRSVSSECGDRAVWAGGPRQKYVSKDGGKRWRRK